MQSPILDFPLQGKKLFFASDFHLGAPSHQESKTREKRIIRWLDQISDEAAAVFLVGDIFDFWFEYGEVIPKGFIPFISKISQLRDKGIPVLFFTGNHDLWMNDYFETELNIPVYHDNKEFTFNGKTFLIGHGDGKGPGDMGYKRMKKVFTNPFSKWLFRWLHPDIGVKLAQYLSVKNKLISGAEDVKYLGEDNEWLVQYCKRKLETKHYDFFVFGHRHLPLNIDLKENSKYINLGDWIGYFTYGVFDGEKMELKEFKN